MRYMAPPRYFMNKSIKPKQDDVISYREMCDAEDVQTLQRGMNFRLKPTYSVLLMSQRTNAPYQDRLHPDGITIEYEGHDVPRTSYGHNPKEHDQEAYLPSERPTQNGLFIKAVKDYQEGRQEPEAVKIYEKILPGVWSMKGMFRLIDYKIVSSNGRNVYRFILRLDPTNKENTTGPSINSNLEHTRVIPSAVKKEVWQRDNGKCVICHSADNLHFDHELPYSKGGSSATAKNIRILCMRHNLTKSAKIE